MPRRFLRLIAVAIASAAAFSQSTPTEFEVASVKPNNLNDRIVAINVGPGGRFTARGYTLQLLIQRAYGVMGFNIVGGPPWLDSDRYDVSAKASIRGNMTEAQLKPMLRAMLADRFKLHLHQGSREVSGYALVVARDGPKIKRSADAEDRSDSFRLSWTELKGEGISMRDLARFVGGKLGLMVTDKTALEGFYDVKAQWPADLDPQAPGDDRREALRSAVFAALPNQLGLRLVAQKITIETLVIDHAEKASAN